MSEAIPSSNCLSTCGTRATVTVKSSVSRRANIDPLTTQKRTSERGKQPGYNSLSICSQCLNFQGLTRPRLSGVRYRRGAMPGHFSEPLG